MNRREELKKVPEGCGVEIDLRDGPDGKIYLEHNPFSQGEDFEEYINCLLYTSHDVWWGNFFLSHTGAGKGSISG